MRLETIATGFTAVGAISISPDGRLAAFSQNRELDGVQPVPAAGSQRRLMMGVSSRSDDCHPYGDLAWMPDQSMMAVV